jgi:hypothetical protein
MKYLKILEILKDNSFFRKKFKYILVIGIGGILIFGGLFIYVSYTAFNQVAKLGKDFDFFEATKNIPVISNVSCMDKAKSLMNVTAWIETPPMDNLIKLKQVCLEERTIICESPGCESQREIKTVKKGEYI